MTTEWFESVKTELLAHNPFRESEYFKHFAAGTLSPEQAWGHVSQWYLVISWFPRMFSGIHSRCEELDVRKDCARHLLVEDLGYFRGQIGGTPDHVELYQRIGDDMGRPRAAWSAITAIPEMKEILAYFGRLAHEIPWNGCPLHHRPHRGRGGRDLAHRRARSPGALRLSLRVGGHELPGP